MSSSRRVSLFLLIAFGLCYAIGFTYFGLGGEVTNPTYAAVALGCMITPAIAAIIVHKVMDGRPLSEIGLRFTWSWWLLWGALLMIGVVLLSTPLTWLVPDIQADNGIGFIISQVEAAGLDAAEMEAELAEVERFGVFFPLVLIGATVIAGIIAAFTINGAVALGEELGWRGFLQTEWQHLGFWQSSFAIGVLWGLWHLPLILNGHNYPQHPRWGVLMMVAFCVLASPLHAYVTRKADTVLAAAVMHGAINAVAAMPLFFAIGGSDLTRGFTGFPGFAALAIANLLLWLFKRNELAQWSNVVVENNVETDGLVAPQLS